MHQAPAAFHRLRSLRWAALLCLAGSLVACKPPSLGSKPDAAAAARALPLAEEARKRLLQGDTAGALQQLGEALKADRSLASIHLLLGQVQLAVGDVVAAEAAFTNALRLGTERNELVLPLATALMGQGQPQALLDQSRLDDAGLLPHVRLPLLLMKAEAASNLGQAAAAQKFIDTARALNPTQPSSWLAEARIRLLAGQADSAVAPADRALALAQGARATGVAAPNATLIQALTTRGDVALALGDQTAAQTLYMRAIAASPEGLAAHDARLARAALQLEGLGDSPAGAPLAADIEALSKAAPGDPRVAFLAALLADRQGRPEDARKALAGVAQTLQRVPAEALRYRPQLLLMGGLAQLALGDTDKARGHLEMAQREAVSAGPATRLIARSYLVDNNVERAITVLEAHIKQRPLDQQALLMLVGAQLSLGRHTRAINLLQDTLSQKDSAAVRGMLAAGNASTGGLQAAQGELTLALKATPGHTGLQAALCALQLHSGQPAKAVQNAQALAQREPDKPGWQHLLGVAQLRLGQAAAARRAFEAAVRLDPGFAAPQVALARLEAAEGNMDSAQKHLQAVLQHQPRHADALFEMGRIDLQRQQPATAQGWFEKAQAAAAPGDNQAALALFDLLLGQRKLPAATAVLRPLALRQPDDLLVILAQARLAMANNEAITTKTLLTRATGLAGYEAGALVQVALLNMQMQPQAQARKEAAGPPALGSPVAASAPAAVAINTTAGAQYALEKALADNPGLLAAQALMVDVELRLGELDRAQARVQQLLASHPRLALVQALQGDVALARGQTAVALAAYRRAQQMEPSSANLLRIHRSLRQTDPAAANAAASQWLEQRPADHAVRRVLADGQARLGLYPAARANYELIAKATPGDAETLNNLAHVLLLLKDPGAVAAAEKALEAQPEAAHIMATAGWANIVAGKTERGMNWLRDARLREPDNADTRYFMAAALAQLGRKAEARTEAAAAQALGRPFVHAKDTEALLGEPAMRQPLNTGTKAKSRPAPTTGCGQGLPAALLFVLLSALLSTLSPGAAAQGTWLQTQCLAAAGSPGPCKAEPAWGQTGLEHVQALAAAAGPGNLGQSLTKPETLPAGHAARSQVAAVMLGFMDSDRPSGTYRWFGPVVAPSAPAASRSAALAAAANAGTGLGAPAAAASAAPSLVATTTGSGAANNPAAPPAISAQAIWLAGALGEEPQARSASWWLAGTYAGSPAPFEADATADRYRVLRFLAAQCPQLEGKVAPNAWTRCTNRSIAEPGAISLVLLALAAAGAASAIKARRRSQPRGDRPPN